MLHLLICNFKLYLYHIFHLHDIINKTLVQDDTFAISFRSAPG